MRCEGALLRWSAIDRGDNKDRILFSGLSWEKEDDTGSAQNIRRHIGIWSSFDETGTWTTSAKRIQDLKGGYSSLAKTNDAKVGVLFEEVKWITITRSGWFRVNDNSTTQIYRFAANTGKIINVATTDNAHPLTDNNWHYVVCVRDMTNSIAKVYVDGTLVKSLTGLTVYDLTNTDGFFIGGQKTNADETTNRFNGQLDDLVIYNRVLADQEIQLLSSF